MPSLNRLLALAILSLSVYVHTAPVRDAARTDMSHEIMGTGYDDMSSRGADDEVLNARKEEAEFGEEDKGASTLELRALQKARAEPTPKLPRAFGLKQKSTASTTPLKTTAKPPKATKGAPSKSTKTAPPKAAATPTKSTKAKASKTTKIKAPKTTETKVSKTAKAAPTAKPTAKSCPAKSPSKKPRTLGARAYDYVAHLFRRDDPPEFIGWHGTNSNTADLWKSAGHIVKPPNGRGTSGANEEIGPGLYITDDRPSAIRFALKNTLENKGTTPQLCAIYAKSSGTWRTAIHKAFIPNNLAFDSAEPAKKAAFEQARLDHLEQVMPNVCPADVVKFALLDRGDRDPNNLTGQLSLPEFLNDQFTATCFKADGGVIPPGTATLTYPDFSYNGNTLRTQWNIVHE